MPKPFHGVNGSGMHVHQSLWKDGQNTFFDDSDPNKISDTLRNFIAGQLSHAQNSVRLQAVGPIVTNVLFRAMKPRIILHGVLKIVPC